MLRVRHSLARSLNTVSWASFLGVGILGLFYVPWKHLRSTTAILLVAIALIVALLYVLLPATDALGRRLARKDFPLRMLGAVVCLGVVIRILWVVFVPPVQLSDMLDYWNAALGLLHDGTYRYVVDGHVLRAWRPPGYPFLLAAVIGLSGEGAWVPAAINLICYVLTSLATYATVRPLAGGGPALMSAVVLALWPNYVELTGLGGSASLSLALYSGALWAILRAKDGGPWYAVLAGLLTGYGMLVRPSILVLPVLWVLYLAMNPGARWRDVRTVLVATVVAFALIAPWTARNHQVLGAFVPVSTNGGDVLYRANNPLATGSWTPRGERDLSRYLDDEVLWSRMGAQWAKEWIRENPVEFIKLAVRKQGILLGDDTSAIYWSLDRGHGIGEGTAVYRAFSWLSNGAWVLIWMLAVAGTIKERRYLARDPSGGLILLMGLFFVVVHSVFESQSRYHVPMIGVLAMLAALSLKMPSEGVRPRYWPVRRPGSEGG